MISGVTVFAERTVFPKLPRCRASPRRPDRQRPVPVGVTDPRAQAPSLSTVAKEVTAMTSDELRTALGRAVAAVWGDLPARVQHDLFEAAVRTAGKGARDELAKFLHGQHPRTIDGAQPPRHVPEPDSLGG